MGTQTVAVTLSTGLGLLPMDVDCVVFAPAVFGPEVWVAHSPLETEGLAWSAVMS